MRIRSGMRLLFVFAAFWTFLPVSGLNGGDDILMTIEGREITSGEFMRLWEKSSFFQDAPDMEEYLDLFINFHLKVAHAREKGIHTQKSFQDEFTRFRRKLAAPYMGDPGLEEKLAREAYERLRYDIDVSHILVRLVPGYSPEDTLMAWEKAMMIREQLLQGESFEKLARATSDDPSAKTNSGNLGFFTALQTAYSFENAVYNAVPGEIGMPVRTQFGYHVIRVNEKRRSKGEIKVAHIMIGFNRHEEEEARVEAERIHKAIQAGHQFELLAREHSTDHNTARQGGVIDWFGSGRFVPEFENAAFSLNKPGDISEPVRTRFGYHLIKLIGKRERLPYEEMRGELIEAVRDPGSNRSMVIRSALLERLRTEWNFREDRQALAIFQRIIDEGIFDGSWQAPQNLALDRTLFSVTGKSFTQRDFAAFIIENAYARKPWPIDEYIDLLYDGFVGRILIELEDNNLEEKYPEFGFMMNEYRDGMLLYEISNREIWTRAMNDSAGLAEFYETNKYDYMWGQRLSATIFSTENNRLARKTRWRARRSNCFSGRDEEWIVGRLNRREGETAVTYREGLFTKGEDEIVDRIKWDRRVSGVHATDNEYKVVLVNEIIDSEPRTLDEARGRVIADYQDQLEEIWVSDLREKYQVSVNREVLSTIKQPENQ
jgi:peptidyl-prolyl cis-trans isomerase SurA